VRPRSQAGQDDPYGKGRRSRFTVFGARVSFATTSRACRTCKLLRLLVDAIRDLAAEPPPASEAVLVQRLKAYKANLRSYTRPDRPYAALASAFIRQFEAELTRMTNEGR
jgi:CRP-like cAMP-binding protein